MEFTLLDEFQTVLIEILYGNKNQIWQHYVFRGNKQEVCMAGSYNSSLPNVKVIRVQISLNYNVY